MTTPRLAHLLNRPSHHPGRDVRMHELSEWMSEHGGSMYEAHKALGWRYDNTKQIWYRILKRMGPQAV
jgi:hypothetical protein